MTNDIVYTVEDYFDGPRAGFATFEGRLHHYRSASDQVGSESSERFVLTPVEDECLPAVLESWQIWRRWEQSFTQGGCAIETHPALPEDRTRHDQLKQVLASAVRAGESQQFVAVGIFSRAGKDAPGSALVESEVLRVAWRVAAA